MKAENVKNGRELTFRRICIIESLIHRSVSGVESLCFHIFECSRREASISSNMTVRARHGGQQGADCQQNLVPMCENHFLSSTVLPKVQGGSWSKGAAIR